MLTASAAKSEEYWFWFIYAPRPLNLPEFCPCGVGLMVPLSVPTIVVWLGFAGLGPGWPLNCRLTRAGALKPVASVVKPWPLMLSVTTGVGADAVEEMRPRRSMANRLNGTPVEVY